MKKDVREAFNRLASVYAQSVDTDSPYNSEYERPAMLEQLPEDLEGHTALDAGCAAGWYTSQLTDRGARVTGIDSSENMVDAARQRIGNQAEILHLDLEDPLPFEQNSFDLIISSLTLHYIRDWTDPFKEFKRVLKPGGILLFSVHHPLTDINLLEDADYFSTELIRDTWHKNGQSYDVPFFRRSLQSVMNETLAHFTISGIVEPLPTAAFREQDPEQFKRLMKRPQFLIVKAT
ncbi:class I SAM-dependent methyltransferase [Planococcus lenghuensis]|uniref:SAM-dependent methyltransferase n=1 Tax=Planococcus lenghuensis TaxID=2213202 RepID=A0A1Q2KYC1_9BACL|nr:class I SAM-dependent methyltransferase [Planococcus lenghuensis]AQQ53104.1 SAM-dependent methyltransferase [Planococcus lenghuensis]